LSAEERRTSGHPPHAQKTRGEKKYNTEIGGLRWGGRTSRRKRGPGPREKKDTPPHKSEEIGLGAERLGGKKVTKDDDRPGAPGGVEFWGGGPRVIGGGGGGEEGWRGERETGG